MNEKIKKFLKYYENRAKEFTEYKNCKKNTVDEQYLYNVLANESKSVLETWEEFCGGNNKTKTYKYFVTFTGQKTGKGQGFFDGFIETDYEIKGPECIEFTRENLLKKSGLDWLRFTSFPHLVSESEC